MFARPSDDIKQLSTESLSGGVNQKLSFSRRVLDFIRQNGVLIGMILVLIVFQTIEHKFFAVKNLLNVLNQSSLLIIMSTGMMMAMSVRAVDLSIAQVADASGLLAALLLIGKYPTWVVFLVPLLFGAFVGLVNCLLVSYLGVPAIIATLGSMFIISQYGVDFDQRRGSADSLHIAQENNKGVLVSWHRVRRPDSIPDPIHADRHRHSGVYPA